MQFDTRGLGQFAGDCFRGLQGPVGIRGRLHWGSFVKVMHIAWGVVGATCKNLGGGDLGKVLGAFLGDCLGESWGKSCELSGGYRQFPWGVLLEICEILGRSLPLAGGTSGRLPWHALGLQSPWGS